MYLELGTKTEELFHAWAGDLFALFKHRAEQTRQSHSSSTTAITQPQSTWPSWPTTRAWFWSTDQTIHVLLLGMNLIFAEIKEDWAVFYLLTGPTLSNIWIVEHPLNKSLCPCQNRGLLQMAAANFTKNEILLELWCLKYTLIQWLVTGVPANLWSTRSSAEHNHLWDVRLETGAK